MPVQETLYRRLVRFGAIVAAVRIGVFWYLFARQTMGNESIDELPLVFLLMPEGLCLPRNWSWTLSSLIGASLVLLISSALITWIFLAVFQVAESSRRSRVS